MGWIGRFLDAWNKEDEGFTRIISTREEKDTVVLSYRCLDPSTATKEVVDNCHNVICMSGTLTPTKMYKDILGFEEATEMEFENPFPEKNRLNLVIPETTTKFTKRNEKQFQRIAEICSKITNIVPGNSAVFFPSYNLRDLTNNYFYNMSKKEIILEKPMMGKKEKSDLLTKFKKNKDKGSVLMGTTSGSFAEGIDLPGDLLKCVIVVGLPLNPPNLEISEIINYYDRKYGKGWDYGYIFPAMTKCLQSAGRCIRSEDDKGIIIFLDERFSSDRYLRCFPKGFITGITKDFDKPISGFFRNL